MASLNELIYSIRNAVNGGISNRADKYSDRLIANWIDKYRAFLAKNDITKNAFVNSAWEQDLGCLSLSVADASMCAKYCWGENVRYVDLPEVIDLPDNMGITYFGLVSKQDRLMISNFNYGNYSNFSRHVPPRIRVEKIRNRLYLHGVDDIFALEGVNARIVAADPADLKVCGTDKQIVCFDWDKDCYPLPAGMESALIDLIMSKEVGMAAQVKPDTSDDDVTANTL